MTAFEHPSSLAKQQPPTDCLVRLAIARIIPASPVVFLDRDGVVNKDLGRCVRRPSELVFLPGALEALRQLHHAGITVAVVSNQADVGRGAMSTADLEQIDDHLKTTVKSAGGHIALSLYCRHTPEDNCACRKPKTGMLETAEEILGPFDKPRTLLVGDRASDLEAGARFGIHTILVRTGYGNTTSQRESSILVKNNLADAVSFIVETHHTLNNNRRPLKR